MNGCPAYKSNTKIVKISEKFLDLYASIYGKSLPMPMKGIELNLKPEARCGLVFDLLSEQEVGQGRIRGLLQALLRCQASNGEFCNLKKMITINITKTSITVTRSIIKCCMRKTSDNNNCSCIKFNNKM